MQPGYSTVQGCLETALARLANGPVKLHGSGRTDQGVHAAGQVAHCDLPFAIPPANLERALNALLSTDIRVLRVHYAPADFHARCSAVGKEYRYFIWNGPALSPFLRLYRTSVRVPLRIGAMRRAATLLVGFHDFAAFSANPNRLQASTSRHLRRLTVSRRGAEVMIRAEGEGFLYKMVRSLAGFLIRVGSGAAAPDDALTILHSNIRTARVPTAPPQGLFLWHVRYPTGHKKNKP